MKSWKKFLSLVLTSSMIISLPSVTYAAEFDTTAYEESDVSNVSNSDEDPMSNNFETTDAETPSSSENDEVESDEQLPDFDDGQTNANVSDFSSEEDFSSGETEFVDSAEATSITATKPADGTTTGQPFPTGTAGSQYFRIPSMVTVNNTIVAATDARWDTLKDGYGLDTIVSRSVNNGATWNYTFANYLGDNGNKSNKSSTAFIDPALAVDNGIIYMLVDLYPTGGIITNLEEKTGYNSDGNLILKDAVGDDYYLKDGQIYKNNGSVIADLTVDSYFNIKGTYNDTEINTNLFFSNSPFKVLKTSYLYLTTSSDGGANWSTPTMLNPQVKKEGETFYGVGPGRGLVTTLASGAKRIIFPCYTYKNGNQKTSVIYSDDNGINWKRSADMTSESSEATLVEAGGHIYMFTRKGGYYVSEDHGETWSEKKNVTTISYNLDCQINAITYSKEIDGHPAILLSAPANEKSRTNGKIFVGLVQDDGTINWKYEKGVTTGKFGYSCMTETSDGKIALLYESGASETDRNTFGIEKFEIYDINTIVPDKQPNKDPQENGTVTVKVADLASVSLNTALGDGESVKWTSSDYTIGGVYSTDSVSANIVGRKAGSCTVTATITDANGNEIAVSNWNVTVTDAKAPNAGEDSFLSLKRGHTVTYTINNTIYNGKIYYSIDGGGLVEVPVSSKTTDSDGNTIYTYDTVNLKVTNVRYSQIDLFVKPDEGYAVSTVTATEGNTYSQFYGIDKDNVQVIYKTDHKGGKLEDCLTDAQEKAVLQEAIEKGCDAVFWYSRGSEEQKLQNDSSVSVTHGIRCDKLPTINKEIVSLRRADGTVDAYKEGMVAHENDTAIFKITVTKYKESVTESENKIKYTNVHMSDEMSNISNDVKLYKDVDLKTECDNPLDLTTEIGTDGLNAAEHVYYAAYTIGKSDLDKEFTNTVDLSYNYQSFYSTGNYGGSANAKAKFIATNFPGIDPIVIDFGLPVEVSVGKWESALGVGKVSVTGKSKYNYGTVDVTGDNVSGIKVTYTPTTILKSEDIVVLTATDGENSVNYEFKVYPATTVYYEENFAEYTDKWTFKNSDMIDLATNKSFTQTKSSVGSKDHYGYDSVYDGKKITEAVSTLRGDKATFNFTGTGIDIYANANTDTGTAAVALVKNADTNTTVQLFKVYTKTGNGGTNSTSGQAVESYNEPIVSVQDLPYGNYTVTITHGLFNGETEAGPLKLDGFRIYGTLADEENEVYAADLEENPSYVELRDKMLAALDEDLDLNLTPGDVYNQVYANAEGEAAGAVVVSTNLATSEDEDSTTSANDLLENGPKNEIHLRTNESLVFDLKTSRMAQIGLKVLNDSTNYKLSIKTNGTLNKMVSNPISSNTDMFYELCAPTEEMSTKNITITNTGSNVLVITKLKICDDPSAALAALTEDDFTVALNDLGIAKPEEPTPSPTSKPEEPTPSPTSKPEEPTPSPTSKPEGLVKLSTPKLGKVVSVSYNSVKVTWNKVKDADGYRVYMKQNGKWKSLGKVDSNSYTCKGLKTGKKYTFTVRAYKNTKDGVVLSAYDKKGISGTPKLSTPVLKSAKRSASGVTFTWKKTAGANGYVVYRKANNGAWRTAAKVTKGTTYKDTTAKKGVKYTYTVRALRKSGATSVYSDYNAKGISVK